MQARLTRPTLTLRPLSEVQAVCRTILIISKGRRVACDTPENLEKMFEGAVTVELTAEASAEEVKEILSDLEGVRKLEVLPAEDGRCNATVEVDRSREQDICRDVFFAFCGAGKALVGLSTAKVTLEDVFIELTDGQPEEKPAQEVDEA